MTNVASKRRINMQIMIARLVNEMTIVEIFSHLRR